MIFTESTRTQQYLFERLSKEKYNGKVLLFNGYNNDELSSSIYQKWVADKNNYGKLTHSKSVDIRNALVDAFKSDDYQIMIATEAAAEGINYNSVVWLLIMTYHGILSELNSVSGDVTVMDNCTML